MGVVMLPPAHPPRARPPIGAAPIHRLTARVLQRFYADEKKPSIEDSQPAKLPSSETNTAAASETPDVTSSVVDTKDVPLEPPAPEQPVVVPPRKRGFFRRLRSYLFTLAFFGALAFGGGVWYSRINDDFHDLFAEYVPFAEQAVLFLEERDLKKRFPNRLDSSTSSHAKDTGAQVKIGPQSGASWRVADSGEPAPRSSSAVRDSAGQKKEKNEAPKQVKPVAEPKPEPVASPAVEATVEKAVKKPAKKEQPAFRPPEVNEPSRFPPAGPIDPLKVKDADEPVVQALVKMLNDIITVVNADNSDERFSSTIGKAKNELNKVGSQIRQLKAQVEKDAAAQLASKVNEFEAAASELVNRVERTLEAQEITWRKEFEDEIKRIHDVYDKRVATEMEREKLVNEQKLENKLVEQAVEMQRQFSKQVKDAVEAERDGRLGQLDKLSSAVKELEQLTTGWNDVVDKNLQIQQLHVAVQAVRASLNESEHPRPFVRELVALREIASNDDVVNAAIASINPSAYQRGISSPSQLIDRFRRVANEVRKASLLPDDAGVASHASSWVLSKVMFKKDGLATGDDVESILTRTQTYLEEGDLDKATRELNGLSGWAKTLSRDWLAEARKVLEVQQALDVRILHITPISLYPLYTDIFLGHLDRGETAELEGGVIMAIRLW
jgi:MICOS complex subunit MIC60